MAGICYHCFRSVPGMGACPYCGYDHAQTEKKYPLALKAGTLLANRYLLGRVIGQGGFGITYVALDQQTRSRVAIKEYLPTEYVSRDFVTGHVLLYSADRTEDFLSGKKQFLDEARTLSEFVGNEHIIKILNYFEENDTAYFAMEFIEGATLKQYMETLHRPLRIEEANRYLLPIMEALEWVHSKGIVHRDISPDNIMIRTDGKAKLIDFGAARNSTGEKSKSLDVVLKHGFAPKEQYTRRGRQGPFTDVYAMAATYYYVITGRVPPDAIERSNQDDLVLPSRLGAVIRGDTEEVLLKALSVSSSERYQRMGEFYQAMLATMPHPFSPEAAQSTHQERREWERKRKAAEQPNKKKNSRGIVLGVAAAAVLILGVTGFLLLRKPQAAVIPEPGPSVEPAPSVTVIPPTDQPQSVVISPAEETPENEPTPEPEEPLIEEGNFRLVGSTVRFGRYEQDNNTVDGPEEIEWIVLDVQESQSLLISKYALDCQQFNKNFGILKWESCTLRTWLNNTFFAEAFTEEEQELVLTTHVENGEEQGNPEWGMRGGMTTKDKVFLLSYKEAGDYLDPLDLRTCQPTGYAVANGASVYSSTGKYDGNCIWWWLRSQGSSQNNTAGVRHDGSVLDDQVNAKGAIRPAIWLDTSTLTG
ncbi:MAG: protein kinase [Oscillospiraceae bacterium]|nr:protein kinase [Oscillospiraceae bacterium]